MQALQSLCPQVVRRIPHVREIAGSSVAIDAQLSINAFLHGYREKNKSSTIDEECVFIKSAICEQVKMLVSHDVHPIYVLDGKAPQCKEKEQLRRRALRNKNQRTAVLELESIAKESGCEADIEEVLLGRQHLILTDKNKADRSADLVRKFNRSKGITHLHILAAKNAILEHVEQGRVDFVQAPGEGERLCAWLCITKRSDYCATADTDAIALRATNVIRHLHISPEAKPDKGFEIIRPVEVMDALGFDEKQFVDWCLLCGTDFHDSKIKGIGWKKAYQFISTHGSIENFLQDKTDSLHYRLEAHDKDFNTARAQFFGCPYEDESQDTFVPRRPAKCASQ